MKSLWARSLGFVDERLNVIGVQGLKVAGKRILETALVLLIDLMTIPSSLKDVSTVLKRYLPL